MSAFDLNYTPATGEPVIEQAPTETQATATPATETTTPGLPAGYLSTGYLAITEKGKKYLRPVYVTDYAETLSQIFAASIKPSDFAALFKIVKSKKSKRLYPYEARQTAIAQAQSSALALVSKKKAPPLLLDFFKANAAAIHDDDDFYAFITHMEVISNLIISEGA